MYYFYFDASSLAKRYTDEVGSDKIGFFFDSVEMILGAYRSAQEGRRITFPL